MTLILRTAAILPIRFLCLLAFLPLTTNGAEMDAGRVREIAAMLPAHREGLGQPATNRLFWDALAARPAFRQWLEVAEKRLIKPMPQTSDELYLEFSRNGNRTHWQTVAFARRERISSLTLAECLENKGRFLPRLEDAIQQICAERTWVMPAHDRSLDNFHGKKVDIDLSSSALALELATADWLLEQRLSAPVRQLIRTNLEARILKPYRDMVEGRVPQNFWLRATHNWNAVCLAGVTGAALALLEPAEQRAWHIASAEAYIQNFLKGFTPDGYCSEGLGYWNYGFGNFVLLGETIRQATGGKIDLIAAPAAAAPAMFWKRIEILNGIYPSIADCAVGSKPSLPVTCYISRRFNERQSCALEECVRPHGGLSGTLLYSSLPLDLPAVQRPSAGDSPLRTWFNDGGVLICRPKPESNIDFAVSLKGGNNAEHHNHNDVGSFIIVAGNSMVLADPGSEVYTARTFSAKRYESDVLNSFGHSVPVVAGKLQRSGSEARGKVLRADFTDEEDALALDIASAYPGPTLQTLKRTFTYSRRQTPSLKVHDHVELKSPETFETALITWGEWKRLSENELLFTDGGGVVRVKVDNGGLPFEIKSATLTADVSTRRKPVRIGFALKQPVLRADFTFTVTPEQPDETSRR